jgi:hypothetical protein
MDSQQASSRSDCTTPPMTPNPGWSTKSSAFDAVGYLAEVVLDRG